MDNPASLKLKATLPTARSCPYWRGQSSSASTAPTCATGTTKGRSSRSSSASRCRRFGTSDYPGLPRFAKAAAGLVTYIDNNAAAIPDYGERRRSAEPISTAFAEATVNLVVGKRFAKKQQMQWSKAGTHLLLQTRTQTLDGTLPATFRAWYPAMAANDTQIPAVSA